MPRLTEQALRNIVGAHAEMPADFFQEPARSREIFMPRGFRRGVEFNFSTVSALL